MAKRYTMTLKDESGKVVFEGSATSEVKGSKAHPDVIVERLYIGGKTDDKKFQVGLNVTEIKQ